MTEFCGVVSDLSVVVTVPFATRPHAAEINKAVAMLHATKGSNVSGLVTFTKVTTACASWLTRRNWRLQWRQSGRSEICRQTTNALCESGQVPTPGLGRTGGAFVPFKHDGKPLQLASKGSLQPRFLSRRASGRANKTKEARNRRNKRKFTRLTTCATGVSLKTGRD